MYSSVDDIDWKNWQPVVRATLMFVIQDGEILLIHKKRGFGQGKINGPGGKLEPGETPLECAIRETQEELCITPTGVEKAGELHFGTETPFRARYSRQRVTRENRQRPKRQFRPGFPSMSYRSTACGRMIPPGSRTCSKAAISPADTSLMAIACWAL